MISRISSNTRRMSRGSSTTDFALVVDRRSSLGALGKQAYNCMYCIFTTDSFYQLEKHMNKHAGGESKRDSDNRMPEYVNYPAYKKNVKSGGQTKFRKHSHNNVQINNNIHGSLQHFSDGITMESTKKLTMSQSMGNLVHQEKDNKPVRRAKKSSRPKVKRVVQSGSNLRSMKNLSVSTASLKRVAKHQVKRHHHASQSRLVHGSPNKINHYSKKPRNTRVSRTSVTSRSQSSPDLTHQKRSKEVYVCTRCDVRCKSKFSLKMHMVLHMFEKKNKYTPVPTVGNSSSLKTVLRSTRWCIVGSQMSTLIYSQ